MKKSTKRSLSILMSVLLTVAMSSPVFAASVASNEPIVASAQSAGGGAISPMYSSIPGANAANISGGYGEVPVTIGKYISKGYFQAAVSSNKNSGTINVAVRYPSGLVIGLGSMAASGDSTTLKTAYGLSAGTYTFIFEPSSTATFNVQGYIYQ